MRALIVDDNFLNRMVLKNMISAYFEIDVTVNGVETLEAFNLAHFQGKPYDVIFLDIMMPEMDGAQTLVEIRKIEKSLNISPKNEVKIIMVTALDSPRDVIDNYFTGGCTSYIVKPLIKPKLIEDLKKLGIILS